MCCGPQRIILERHSERHKCCGHEQYDSGTHCCCSNNDALGIHPLGSSCCSTHSDVMFCGPSRRKHPRASVDLKCCGEEQFSNLTHCCCQVGEALQIHPKESSCCPQDPAVPVFSPGPLYDFCGPTKTRHLRKSVHHKCCGSNYFSSLTHCCCQVGEALEIRLKDSSCCPLESDVMFCGPSRRKHPRTSVDLKCCGEEQFSNLTHCCCQVGEALQIHPKESSCCPQDPAVPVFSPGPLYDFCGSTKTRHLRKSVHHKCCGSNYFSSLTHCCCQVGEALEIRLKDSSCCPLESDVMFCGPSRRKHPRTSVDLKCCGEEQFSNLTHCCCQVGEALQIHSKESSCCPQDPVNFHSSFLRTYLNEIVMLLWR
ncbi:uncharacterized protein LOC142895019 [Nelusetta ayraudi]|uniref:uncharacterized protein LOC142895019 n=1 Tax=Nelusetta ayraudi TaxID=303726 RepID=UPI003F726D6D